MQSVLQKSFERHNIYIYIKIQNTISNPKCIFEDSLTVLVNATFCFIFHLFFLWFL